MVDADTKPTELFALFDGDEIDGTFYALGERISEKVAFGTIAYLQGIGRIGSEPPKAASMAPILTSKDVATMTRGELLAEALAITATQLDRESDDSIRDGIERHRAQSAESGGAGEGTAETYDDIKDLPLAGMTTARLIMVADAEGVTFDDKVKTNGDRVAAIQAARDAKANAS